MTNSEIVRMGASIFRAVGDEPVPLTELRKAVSGFGARSKVFGKYISKACSRGIFTKIGNCVVRRHKLYTISI